MNQRPPRWNCRSLRSTAKHVRVVGLPQMTVPNAMSLSPQHYTATYASPDSTIFKGNIRSFTTEPVRIRKRLCHLSPPLEGWQPDFAWVVLR
jgi:hypothetical protein